MTNDDSGVSGAEGKRTGNLLSSASPVPVLIRPGAISHSAIFSERDGLPPPDALDCDSRLGSALSFLLGEGLELESRSSFFLTLELGEAAFDLFSWPGGSMSWHCSSMRRGLLFPLPFSAAMLPFCLSALSFSWTVLSLGLYTATSRRVAFAPSFAASVLIELCLFAFAVGVARLGFLMDTTRARPATRAGNAV